MRRAGLLRVGVAVALAATIVAIAAARSHTGATPAPVARTVSTAEVRHFTKVVTLAGSIRTRPAVTVQAAVGTVWSKEAGAPVTKGEAIGAAPGGAGNGSASDLADQVAQARADLKTAKELAALDVAEARNALAAAVPEQRAQLQIAYQRVQITTERTIRDGEAQVARLQNQAAAGEGVVVAPADGTLILPNAPDGTASVQPPGYQVAATVDPLLMYDLAGVLATGSPSAQVTISSRGLDFACSQLHSQTSAGSSNDAGPTMSLVCDVPATTTVYAQTPVTMAVTVVDLTDALLIPVTTVRTSVNGRGVVMLEGANGQETSRTVALGATDGLVVQVLDGLTAGDRVLDQTGVQASSGGQLQK